MQKFTVRSLVVVLLGVGACGVDTGSSPPAATDQIRATTPTSPVTPLRTSTPEATCSFNFTNHGGGVNHNANLVAVKWGGGVTPESQALVGFFSEIFNQPYMNWLRDEYQAGSGTFYGLYQITPLNNSNVLYDTDISAELSYQISHGYIPSFSSNAVYAVYLPLGKTAYLTGQGLIDPCDPNAKGAAYHQHTSSFDFLVMPDTDSCALNNLDGLTYLTTHELAEALTDPDGHSGWNSNGTCPYPEGCEIGDICAHTPVTGDRIYLPSQADKSYLVATLFDANTCQCRVQRDDQKQHSSLVWYGKPTPRSFYDYVSLWSIPNGVFSASNQSSGVDTSFGVVAVGDINRDGQADILWRSWLTNAISVWFMQNGVYSSSASTATTTSDWSVKGLADFNGDGVSDVVLMNNSTSEVDLWYMSTNGSRISIANLGLATGKTFLGTGDFDHDGTADIAFSYPDGTGVTHIALWLVRNLSVYSVIQPLSDVSAGAHNAQGLTFGGIGDFDHDGMSDFAWQDSSGTVQLWHTAYITKPNLVGIRGPSSAPNPPEPTYLTGAGSGYLVARVADTDGDGVSDLIFNLNGDIYTWLLRPQFNASKVLINTTYASVHTGTGGWSLVGASYFNY